MDTVLHRRTTSLKPEELFQTEAELQMGHTIEDLSQHRAAEMKKNTAILRTAAAFEATPGIEEFAACFHGWNETVAETVSARLRLAGLGTIPMKLRDMLAQSERAARTGALASEYVERVRVHVRPLAESVAHVPGGIHVQRTLRYFHARVEAVARALHRWPLAEDERTQLQEALLAASERALAAKARVIPSGKGSVLSKQAHMEAERELLDATNTYRRAVLPLIAAAAEVEQELQHLIDCVRWYRIAERVARVVQEFKRNALVITDEQLAAIAEREPREVEKYKEKLAIIGPDGRLWSNGTSAEFLIHRILAEQPIRLSEGRLSHRVTAEFEDYQGGSDLVFFSEDQDPENLATGRAPFGVIDATMNVDKYEQHFPGRLWSLNPSKPPFMVRRTIIQLHETLVAQFIREFLLNPESSARDLYEQAAAASGLPVHSTVPKALTDTHPIPVLDYESFRAYIQQMLEAAPEPSPETAQRKRARLTSRTKRRT